VQAVRLQASKVGGKEFHTIVKATRKTLGIQGIGEHTEKISVTMPFAMAKGMANIQGAVQRCFLIKFD